MNEKHGAHYKSGARYRRRGEWRTGLGSVENFWASSLLAAGTPNHAQASRKRRRMLPADQVLHGEHMFAPSPLDPASSEARKNKVILDEREEQDRRHRNPRKVSKYVRDFETKLDVWRDNAEKRAAQRAFDESEAKRLKALEREERKAAAKAAAEAAAKAAAEAERERARKAAEDARIERETREERRTIALREKEALDKRNAQRYVPPHHQDVP
jgi:hypothetical protein